MKELKLFVKEIKLLLKSKFFIYLTILGNGLIGLSGLLFYLLEKGVNPKVNRYMDALWWSFATATTTGYGDITPITDLGKILSILLMLMGLALFSMYTALFAETIMASKNFMKDPNGQEDQ